MKEAGLLPPPFLCVLNGKEGRKRKRKKRMGKRVTNPISVIYEEEEAPARNCLFLVVIMILDEALHASRHIGRLWATYVHPQNLLSLRNKWKNLL